MNLATLGADQQSSLLFVNFNQDCTSLAVGTKSGYKLFSLGAVDKLEQIYDNESEDICIVERLFSSSLVAIVSLSAPRKLKVCHFKKGTEICNYSYSNSILAVRLNRQRLIVCLEESLYIHNIRDMKVLHTIRDTPANPEGQVTWTDGPFWVLAMPLPSLAKLHPHHALNTLTINFQKTTQGLCALSVNNDNCFLAYPGSNQIGEVQIFDTVNLRAVTMIPAHDSPLAALAFNAQGTRIATASEKGTVIRVFSVPDVQKLFEFRRGMKRCVSINSLAFSADSLYLAASSNTETVHIFKLETNKEKPSEEVQSWSEYFSHALKTSANYLPTQVSEMINQGRAFATARLPCSGMRNVCVLAIVQKLPRMLVVSQDGYLYIYNIDPVDGGECMLLRQHRIDGKSMDCAGCISVGSSTAGSGHLTDQPAGQDKPLISPNVTTYAASVRRPDQPSSAANSGTPPGKGHEGHHPVSVQGHTCTNKSPRHQSTSSYAEALKICSTTVGKDLPCDKDECENLNPFASCIEQAVICGHGGRSAHFLMDSQPYQDVEQGAMGGNADIHNVGTLRLDDDNEFPPMTHIND